MLRYRPVWSRLIGTILLGAAAIALLGQGILLAVDVVFPEQVISSFGTIRIARWTETVFLREETFVPAPTAGRFERRQPAGERVNRRGILGTLKPGKVPCRAREPGLIAYNSDGLEKVLTVERATTDPGGSYRLALRGRMRGLGRGSVRRGEPLARLVKDERQYLLVPVEAEKPGAAAGDVIWALEEDGLVPLTVTAMNGDWAVLVTERFPPAWLEARHRRLYLIWHQYTGTMVPLRYIRRQRGKAGVIVMSRGRPGFLPVRILGQDRHMAAVEGLPVGAILLPR